MRLGVWVLLGPCSGAGLEELARGQAGVGKLVGEIPEATGASDGALSFLLPIPGEPCRRPHPPAPQGLWVWMYPQLQVGTRWVGSGAQAWRSIRGQEGHAPWGAEGPPLSRPRTTGLSPSGFLPGLH